MRLRGVLARRRRRSPRRTERSSRLAEGRYEYGEGSVIELGDSQIQEAPAATQAVQTNFQLATAPAQLLFGLGRP